MPNPQIDIDIDEDVKEMFAAKADSFDFYIVPEEQRFYARPKGQPKPRPDAMLWRVDARSGWSIFSNDTRED
jgi:hypothetical protein